MRQLIVILCLLSSLPARAQTFFSGSEWGIVAGGAQYFGDLNDHYGLQYTRPVAGIFGRYHFNPYISLRGSLTYARVGYDDQFSNNAFNRLRNLNFQSDVLEAAVQAEFNFFRFSTGEAGSRWTPYLTGGIGAFHYDPFTTFEGRRYYLRNLGTEGQQLPGYEDRRYDKIAMCFPVGAGFKWWIRPGLNFGFEIANRLTLTDYLDDVSTTYVGADRFPSDPLNPNPAFYLQDRSIERQPDNPLGRAGKQRGNSQTSDQYMYFIFNISFQLKTYRCPNYLKGY